MMKRPKLESYFQDKSLRKDIKIGFLGRFDVYIKGLDILLNLSEYQRSTNKLILDFLCWANIVLGSTIAESL